MNETPFDWDDLRLFLAVARQSGLAAAASETGKSAPILGRRILALEQRLKLELFKRSSTGYTLTAQGHSLFALAAQLESTIQPITSMAGGESTPRVKISAGSWVTHHLCKHVGSRLSENWLPLQFISANHALDLHHREAAIGIRNTRPVQASLAGQPLNYIQFAVYTIDPAITTWVRVTGNTPSAQWVKKHIGTASCIEVTDPRNVLDLLHAGAARAVLPTFIGDEQSGLVRASDNISELEHQQWLVTHHEDRHKPEVRKVITWLGEILGDENLLR
ncbi:hypothetical protein AB833_01590 [Chromatiales bacterium (ex Bugula neritina AB1)]|nr:hypothetical protein AB833_01590 [Chromatiales bacterium (ex Bugula neritina AB1)]